MHEQPISGEAFFVARQPVFRPDSTVWGYELLFRSGKDANAAGVIDGSQATASVIADGLALAMEGMANGARVLINFPEQLLLDGAGFALPRDTCVVEILEDVRPTKQALAAVRTLKDAGYTVAVDDFFGQPSLLPFLELADIVKFDILELGADPGRIRRAMRQAPSGDGLLLAEKVEDRETFRFLRDAGFDLFQGFFFSRPEILPGRKLTSNEMTKLQLLGELSAKEFEPRRLAEILETDPNLSYRLFRYINSVGFGLRSKVTSLKRAIDMMGMLQARQWLRSALMADLNPGPTGGELTFLSVHRAKFLETVCPHSSHRRECVPDALFITGLFSLLDAMLGMDMDDILKKLPLDDGIMRALRGTSEAHVLLDLAAGYEHGRWEIVAEKLGRLGIDPLEADAAYVESRNWTQRMLGASRADGGDGDA